MKKEQLQEWLRANSLPDEWWFSVNGEVKDTPCPLKEALILGDGHDLHVLHASQVESEQWIAVEKGSAAIPPPISTRQPIAPVVKPTIQVPKKGFVCGQCGHFGKPKTKVKGSFLVEIILWLCFILPGLIYSMWRASSASRVKVCPSCETLNMLPISSPGGRQAFLRFHQ